MKKLKLVLFRILIVYFILYILLSSGVSCFASQEYNSSCGQYVSDYARDFIATYCTPETNTVYDNSSIYPSWEGGSIGQGIFHCCCSVGVWYMYNLALNIDLYSYGFNGLCSTAMSQMASSPYWEEVTSESQLQPGDIVIKSSHTELYIGNSQRANFGNSPYSGIIRNGASLTSAGGSFTKAYRLKGVEVDPTGTISVTGNGGSYTSVELSDFYFNGITDGKYSVAHVDILKRIINFLSELADYLIGLLTYIIRIVVVGWTAIFDNLFNWTVNSIINTNTDASELNINAVEIESADNDNRVTMEKMIYGTFDLFDINIFEV